jgi:SPOR domain
MTPPEESPATTATRPRWETCDGCGAPLDESQRYCVSCGARRPGAEDPASRWLASAARRKRGPGASSTGAPQRTTGNARLAVALTLIPVAAAIGVQVGRGGTDDQVLDALKSQKAPVVQVVGGAGTGTAEAAEVTTVESDFPLDKGFGVKVATLPADGTTQADVDAKIEELEGKGIKDLTLAGPEDYGVKPSQDGAYVLVSGAFEKRAEADQALKKIKKKVPQAAVVELTAKGDGGGGDGTGGGGKVIAKTEYGSARQLTGDKISEQDIEESKKALKHIVESKGKEYVEQQRNLPDTIVIP